VIQDDRAPAARSRAHILYMDIIGSGLLPMEQQRAVYEELNELVGRTPEFRRAMVEGGVLCRPSGDGMALVFLKHVEVPLRCAVEMAALLNSRPHLRLRMGVHSGEIYPVKDINGSDDVTGEGIVMAKRVMDCGDAGHILVSHTVAEELDRSPAWADSLHYIGVCKVKHGQRIALWSLHTGEAGNKKLPQLLVDQMAAEAIASHVGRPGSRPLPVREICVLVFLPVLLLVVFGFLPPLAFGVFPIALAVYLLGARLNRKK
jgi:class 3 adenylate cyclase